MRDLSIIIPFAGEFPQVIFTIRQIATELIDSDIDFEIIAVDNYCEELQDQCINLTNKAYKKLASKGDSMVMEDIWDFHRSIPNAYENKSGESIAAAERLNPWLKYVKYEDRLSHWQAKRKGVEHSEGEVLLFLDGHVEVYGLENMYNEYISPHYGGDTCTPAYLYNDATLHLPLTYKILESRQLIYKPVVDNEYFYTYSFTTYRQKDNIYEVPVMSNCGMMISKKIYDAIDGWPRGLGIYGGGENYMNYTLAVCGYKKFIYPHATCFHHGEKRDYHYLYDDMARNRLLAHYLFGGKELLYNLAGVYRGRHEVLAKMAYEAINGYTDDLGRQIPGHKEHRERIKKIQKYDIAEWIKPWIEGK